MKRVVLVRPIGPRNAGMVVRTAANFGPCEVWFVAPRRPSLLVHPEYEQMSHGAEELRARVRVVDTLLEALAECQHAVGFTARPRDARQRRDWRELAGEVGPLADDPAQRLALVFGSDEGGLNKEEVGLCQELAFLPTSAEHTSINLAMSVGVVLFSLFHGEPVHRAETGQHLADGDAREYLKAHLTHVFAERVARTAAAARDITASIERLFSRVPLENRDARAWHQMMRALGSTKSPTDFGLGSYPRNARRDEALSKSQDEPGACGPDAAGPDTADPGPA